MKKTLITCFTGILLNWIIPVSSFAQNVNNMFRLNADFSSGEFITAFGKMPGVSRPDPVALNERNAKAVRHFTRNFKDASNIKWDKLERGYFIVYCSINNINTRLLYNKRGNVQCILQDYKEDKLLPEVRHRIKTTFYDYNIYHVTEIHWYDYNQLANASAHIAILQDNNVSDNKTSWKVIKVQDEMEIIKEYEEKH